MLIVYLFTQRQATPIIYAFAVTDFEIALFFHGNVREKKKLFCDIGDKCTL